MSALQEQMLESAPSGPEAEAGKASYFRFSESPLWKWQAELRRNNIRLPDEAASPLMAEQYADLILAYWLELSDQGALDPEEPLYILELWAGCGRFAFYMLQALADRLAALKRPEWKPVYIISDPGQINLDLCKMHPKLAPCFSEGRAELLLWDGVVPEEGLYLQQNSRVFKRHNIKNPMAVIANFAYGKMPQDLFHIHYGKLHEVRMAMSLKEQNEGDENALVDPAQGVRFDYRVEETAAGERIEEQWKNAVQGYVDRLDNTTLLFPAEALRSLERLRLLSSDRLLLLCADRGPGREKDLRMQGAPEFGFDGLWSLPVNFHALARYAREQKIGFRFSQHQDAGPVFFLMVFNENIGRLFDEKMKEFNPGDYDVLKNMLAENQGELNPAQMASCLRLSHWDPELLRLFLHRLADHPPAYAPNERLMWADMLRQVWEKHYPVLGSDETGFSLGLLAMDLGAWKLGIDCYEMNLNLFDPEPATLHNLALCYHQVGKLEKSSEILKQALSMDPDNAQSRKMLLEINKVQEAQRQTAWYRPELCESGEICLQPLGKQHARTLLYQYRDPNIGVMTRLPELKTEEDAERFIAEEQSDKHKAIFAVMHAAHGFVGTVSLSCREQTGYFYFWIGADYQGQGLGQKAAKILLERIAPQLGVQTVYTSVYRDNIRSKNSLNTLGFESLPFRALEPDQDIVFFMKNNSSQTTNPQTAYGDLMRLLTEVNSSFLLAAWSGREEKCQAVSKR